MGQVNTIPRRINGVEGAAGEVMLSGGPGVLETWGAPAPAAHVHAAGDVTSGQFPLTRMPRAASGQFLEGNGAADPIFNALIAANIPNLAASKITSGQFPLARMPRGAAGDVITGTGGASDPVYAAPVAAGIWTLKETLSPTNVNTITSAALGNHDMFMVILDIVFDDQGVGAELTLKMRINGDTANNYDTRYVDALAVAVTGATSHIVVVGGHHEGAAVGVVYSSIAQLQLSGKSHGSASDEIAIMGVSAMGKDVNYNRILNARWKCGVANVSTLTFATLAAGADTFTGKIKIYYMDY
ncbi:hypothetical protein ES703_22961 [subsurface metagenome]